MPATVLVRLSAPREPIPAAIRRLRRISRSVSALPGFIRWQTFRALDPSNSLIVAVDFATEADARSQAAAEALTHGLAQAGASGCAVETVAIAAESFCRRLGVQTGNATLLRLGRRVEAGPDLAARDSSVSLSALAAPDTLCCRGGWLADGSVGTCRVEFASEDGLWGFLESPLCDRWRREQHCGFEAETWAINLPRLEFENRHIPHDEPLRPANPHLCVELSLDAQSLTAHLLLQGELDRNGTERCRRSCEILLRGGYRNVTVDLSRVTGMSSEVMSLLAQTARDLKARGGEFVLRDNEERMRGLTRARLLAETTL